MSSADPSLSLPHQSHTVPPAHPVAPPSPFSPCSTRVPRSPLSSPLSAEEHPPCHPSELSAHILPHPAVLSRSLSPLRNPLHVQCSPLANRPQLTLIYVIFSERPHVTALQRYPRDQACPIPREGGIRGRMWFAGVMGGGGRVVREEAGE